jgi:ROK family
MANPKKYALGIDLGGTKTLVAVVDITTGEVIASERKRTHAEKGQEYIAQHITHLSAAALESAKLPAGAEIVAVGIGAAGQIDRKKGVVVDAPNLGVKDLTEAQTRLGTKTSGMETKRYRDGAGGHRRSGEPVDEKRERRRGRSPQSASGERSDAPLDGRAASTNPSRVGERSASLWICWRGLE